MKEKILNWIASFYEGADGKGIVNLLQDKHHVWHAVAWTALLLLITIALSGIIWWLTREILLGIIKSFAARTKTEFDDLLVEKKVFAALAHIPALLLLDYFFSIVFFIYPEIAKNTLRYNEALIAVAVLFAVRRTIDALGEFIRRKPTYQGKPIKSYVQTINILITIFFLLLILSMLTGQSPVFFLTSIGAATAIILLIFKDSILGLVASIQMSANDMIRVGDWITMEKYGADGDVTEITLTSVKVQNWDRTITTIPTYSFIAESFKNWRGMSESGGRRISRSINIKIDSVKFASPRLLSKLEAVHFLKEFIQKRSEEIERYNREKGLSEDQINARKRTNIGLFRRYLEFYLKHHDLIRQDMTLMVRQLAPGEHGVPIQIYCFTNTTVWAEYEEIMGDIFDHIFAVVKEFELVIHETPSGHDFRGLIERDKI